MATTTKAENKIISVNDVLMNIQSKLNAPKGQYNSFGRYHYRSCEDILAAVKPLLAENNCTLILTDDIVAVGTRIYVKATAILSWHDGANSGDVRTVAFAREEETKKGMDSSQVTGAASSYARKYALNGLFAIDDTKDADALNTSKEYTQQPTQQPAQNNNAALLAQAKAEAANVKSRADMANWWARFPTLQQNQEMRQLCQQLGTKFPKQ